MRKINKNNNFLSGARAQRDWHYNFGSGSGFEQNFGNGSGSGLKIALGFFGIFDLEQQECSQFSQFGARLPHLCFLWSSSMCLNINLVNFLLKIFTNNYISGGFRATEKRLVPHWRGSRTFKSRPNRYSAFINVQISQKKCGKDRFLPLKAVRLDMSTCMADSPEVFL
jgi:hypothetical protein